jgi:secreted PhoX family phosphatase
MSVDPEDVGCNPSDNPSLATVIEARFSRRHLLQGGLGVAAMGFLGGGAGSLLSSTPAAAQEAGKAWRGTSKLLGFKPLPVSTLDKVVVPEGYTAQVLIPWGTPLQSTGPAWKKDASNTAEEQAQQVGMHHDGMHFFPLQGSSTRGLLVLNHEYVEQVLLFPDGDATITKAKVDKALAAHGVTVIEVQMDSRGRWTQVDSSLNRRVTGATPVDFSGPVSLSHPLLQSSEAIARGTLNNCSHGYTPWGTYLACEENFNGYFGTEDTSFAPSPLEARYGVRKESATQPDGSVNPDAGKVLGFGYRWHPVDPRFDLAKNRGEFNRFGWVVEIDPMKPGAAPVKRTALGRFKHESASVTESAGRVVVYSGDDENREYVYKFVGASRYAEDLAAGRSPLDNGTLYVATFSADGTGRWLPLVFGQGALTEAAGWKDQADVLIRTRMAADAVGATRLHRPEWVSVDPRTKDVYLTLTNGSGAPMVSKRDPDAFGSIVRWREKDGDNTATSFTWDTFLLAGDPQKDDRTSVTETSRFGSPDGIWVDPDGRVWIQTDISNSVQRRGAYERVGNNQMLVADPDRTEIRRFFVGPNGCEVTGVITTPDQRTMFVNIQHPGEDTPGVTSTPVTPANPNAVSSFPDYDPSSRPRSATVVIRKRNGGIIGT